MTLRAPTGTIFTLSDRSGGSSDNIILTNFVLPWPSDASASGNWVLSVQDMAATDTGSLQSWSIAIGDCLVESVSGTVRSAPSAAPLAGVSVYLCDSTGAFLASGLTDSLGRYSISTNGAGQFYAGTGNAATTGHID